MQITKIHAREVLDSRGRPTVEAEVYCGEGIVGSAIAPSGASTGSSEALELRDRETTWYDGLGVRSAVRNVIKRMGPELIGLDPVDQKAIDGRLLELDPTPQKSQLGGNALIAVSLAAAHAGAATRRVPLFSHLRDAYEAETGDRSTRLTVPRPMTNMISGGLHAGGNLDFQDVLVMPKTAPDSATAIEWIVRVYRRLGERLIAEGLEGRLVGDEGGYGPKAQGNRQAVELVVRAIEDAKLVPGEQMSITLDVAATHFFDVKSGRYRLAAESGAALSANEMIDRLEAWTSDFPIESIEDGLAEDDWEGWQQLTERLGDRVWLVGDDLFTTNVDRVQKGIEQRAGNAVLIKVNQIGTLTETFRTIALAKRAGFKTIVSARSGETEDSTIADLATAVDADAIKIGSIVRGERLAKYNRMLRIEEMLASDG